MVYAEIAEAMALDQPFELDFMSEGPDIRFLGLYDFLELKSREHDYGLNQVTIKTSNALESHKSIAVVYQPPMHLLQRAKDYLSEAPKNTKLKHFGIFIGRSNSQRLRLACYLDQHYSNKTAMNYNFNSADDFHVNNIGLEDLIKFYGITDVRKEAEFIYRCPLRMNKDAPVAMNKDAELNGYSQQLLEQDKNDFLQNYRNFFVELVCESYFSGRTFFPTEKVYRPILLKTPFIVQGPQWFMHNMRDLGFKTFSKWWSEGYSEDPDGQQIVEIKKIIDYLAEKTPAELYAMYTEMQPVLEHNYNTAMSLTDRDFKKIFYATNQRNSA